MARPIKETPTLRGKDAERFLRLMDELKPVSKEELEKIRADYEFIKSIATFVPLFMPRLKSKLAKRFALRSNSDQVSSLR